MSGLPLSNPRRPSGANFAHFTTSRASAASAHRGYMIPCAPASSIRPSRMNSPFAGRTRMSAVPTRAARIRPAAVSRLAAWCSRSIHSPSNPIRLTSSYADGSVKWTVVTSAGSFRLSFALILLGRMSSSWEHRPSRPLLFRE